jgi:hypothetical protein
MSAIALARMKREGEQAVNAVSAAPQSGTTNPFGGKPRSGPFGDSVPQ